MILIGNMGKSLKFPCALLDKHILIKSNKNIVTL